MASQNKIPAGEEDKEEVMLQTFGAEINLP